MHVLSPCLSICQFALLKLSRHSNISVYNNEKNNIAEIKFNAYAVGKTEENHLPAACFHTLCTMH